MPRPRKLLNGDWQVRWQIAGRKSRKRNFKRKIDADRFATSVEHHMASGDYVDPSNARVIFDKLAWEWFSTTVALRASTRERDRGYLERYVLATFGGWQLAAVDFAATTRWVAELRTRGLAPATVVKAYQILGKVMTFAVKSRYLPRSPCQGVELPKVERTEMRFLSPDEIATLAEAMDPRYSAAVLLGAYAGLRAGELFGLRAERVDVMHRTVDVAEIVTEVKGALVFGPPKTKAGRRQVPIPLLVAEALDRQLAGGGPKERWVFPAPEGGPVRLGLWRRRFWVPATAAAGLEGLRIHDLRHTGVALWVAAKADPVDIARRAGHTSTSVVLDRYGHVNPQRRDAVTDALEEMARAAKPTPMAPVKQIRPQ
jgi:integrase